MLSVSRDPADVREAYERAAATPPPSVGYPLKIDSLRPPPGDGRQRFSHPIIAIGADAKGTRNETLAQQLIDDYDFPDMTWALASALLHVGGDRAERWLLRLLPEQSPRTRAEMAWALEGSTLETLLARCRDAGVIATVPDSEMVRRTWLDCWAGADANDFRWFEPFITLLIEMGAAVRYPYDPGEDIYYDRLIRLFTRCMPWLRVEALSETLLGHETRDEGRVIQFVVSGRRYRLELENSIWRYVWGRDIVRMLHQVLEDEGREERFFLVEDEETKILVCAVPEAARQLARSIYLPLVEEPQIAERAVQEFIARRRRS